MGTDDGDPACSKPRGVLAVLALPNLRHSWPSHKIPPYRSSRRPQRNSSEGELRFHPARSSIFTMMIRRMAHYSDTPWLHERCAALHRYSRKLSRQGAGTPLLHCLSSKSNSSSSRASRAGELFCALSATAPIRSSGAGGLTTSSRKTSCTFGTPSCRSGRHSSSCTPFADRCRPCSLIAPAPHQTSHMLRRSPETPSLVPSLLVSPLRWKILLPSGANRSCSRSCRARRAAPWRA